MLGFDAMFLDYFLFLFGSGLCEGVQLDVISPGFPTLKHLPHRVS